MTDTPDISEQKPVSKTKIVLFLVAAVSMVAISGISLLREPVDVPQIDSRMPVSQRDPVDPVTRDPVAEAQRQLMSRFTASQQNQPVEQPPFYAPSPTAAGAPKRYGFRGQALSAPGRPEGQSTLSLGQRLPSTSDSPSAARPDFLADAIARMESLGLSLPAPPQTPSGPAQSLPPQAEQAAFIPAPNGPAILAGSVIRGRVDVATHSDYSNGLWRGMITQDVVDLTGRHVLVPAGSRLIGLPFRPSTANEILNERLGLGVSAIVRPDGSTIRLADAVAFDARGIPAIEGNVNKHGWKRFGGFAAYALLGVVPGLTLDTNTEAQSSSDRALRDLTRSTTRAASAFAEPYLTLVPTVRVPAGTSINIIISENVEVPPYG